MNDNRLKPNVSEERHWTKVIFCWIIIVISLHDLLAGNKEKSPTINQRHWPFFVQYYLSSLCLLFQIITMQMRHRVKIPVRIAVHRMRHEASWYPEDRTQDQPDAGTHDALRTGRQDTRSSRWFHVDWRICSRSQLRDWFIRAKDVGFTILPRGLGLRDFCYVLDNSHSLVTQSERITRWGLKDKMFKLLQRSDTLSTFAYSDLRCIRLSKVKETKSWSLQHVVLVKLKAIDSVYSATTAIDARK